MKIIKGPFFSLIADVALEIRFLGSKRVLPWRELSAFLLFLSSCYEITQLFWDRTQFSTNILRHLHKRRFIFIWNTMQRVYHIAEVVKNFFLSKYRTTVTKNRSFCALSPGAVATTFSTFFFIDGISRRFIGLQSERKTLSLFRSFMIAIYLSPFLWESIFGSTTLPFSCRTCLFACLLSPAELLQSSGAE
jgi:hypothetical protein